MKARPTEPNWMKWIALAAALVVAVPGLRADLKVGDRFPDLASVGLTGAALPETQGKVVLVDFWASWCAPCKASFPTYARLNSEFGPKGLVIVAVSVDQDPGAFHSFVGKYTPPFTAVLDHDHQLVSKAQVPTMPTSYLIDKTGAVRAIHPGFHGEETEKTLRTEITALLSAN